MKTLFLLNDPPYGTERSYNALRLAGALSKRTGEELRVFLMADASVCAKTGQNTPEGYYNISRMLKGLTSRSIPVAVCGSCMDARGIAATELQDGAHRSSMEELTDWTLWADKVIVF